MGIEVSKMKTFGPKFGFVCDLTERPINIMLKAMLLAKQRNLDWSVEIILERLFY